MHTQSMHPGACAQLVIADTTIRQHEGLYSLNDLHRASGGEAKHQPALFLRLEQTKELIAEIVSSTDLQSLTSSANSRSLAIQTVIGKGKQQGTYACKELVIAYAAWISAAFHLKVIRVFLKTLEPETKFIPYTDLTLRLAKMAGDLLPQYSLREAYYIANQALMEETGVDVLHKCWPADILARLDDRPAALPERLPAPQPSREDRQLARLMRHLSNISIFLKSRGHNNSQRRRLFEKKLFPRQSLLKAMHTTAAEFDRLINRGKELDLLIEIDGTNHGYKGKLYAVAGGAQ